MTLLPIGSREQNQGLSQSIHTEQVDLLYKQATTAFIAGMAAVMGVVAAFWGLVSDGYLAAWFFAVVISNIYLVILIVLYRQSAPGPARTRLFDKLYNSQALIHGCAWGALTPMAYSTGSDLMLAFSLMVVLGMTSGSIMATGSIYRIFFSYTMPALAPAIVLLVVFVHNPVWTITGALVIIYVVSINIIGYGYYQSVYDSFRLRYENSELVTNLLAEKNRSEEARIQLEQEVQIRKETEGRITQAMLQAEAANTAKSRFLANMSHEIRTPLTAIMGFADTLVEERENPKQLQHHIDAIMRNSRHLLHIINEVLDFSKIEADRLELERLPISLFDFISDVEETFSYLAREKGIGFDIAYHYPVPREVYTDPTRMKQVMFNLVSNALKFTQSGFIRIGVNYEKFHGRLRITVEDTGVGMSPEQTSKLFQPFTQADASTTRRYGGTGLGLAISQRLALLLGGKLEVSSLKDAGSRFTLVMKTGVRSEQDLAYSYEAPDIADDGARLMPRRLHGTVLLAEDNRDIQELAASYLYKLGVKVVLASDGREAVNLALQGDVDLVLMDMQMPVMDGLEATRELRKRGMEIPIIALTANAMAEDRMQYQQAGANDFLAKPIDQRQLINKLGYFLSPQETLGQRAGDGMLEADEEAELIAEFKAKFVGKLPEYLARMNELFSKQDLSGLTFIAHDLKGLGASFGFPTISEISAKIESQARQADLEKVSLDIQALNSYCATIG